MIVSYLRAKRPKTLAIDVGQAPTLRGVLAKPDAFVSGDPFHSSHDKVLT